MAEIKDNGDRTQFDTGAVRDLHEGKGRFDLLPWPAIWEVAKHCENGAKKYGEHNVDKGIPVHSLIDSAIRHTIKFWLGWEDEPHLTAACWNLLFALNMMLVKPEMDDRPTRIEINEVLNSIPAADVRPVRRGKWTSVFDIGTVCNQCGYDIEEHGFDVRTDGEPNYCPNCGADMREES